MPRQRISAPRPKISSEFWDGDVANPLLDSKKHYANPEEDFDNDDIDNLGDELQRSKNSIEATPRPKASSRPKEEPVKVAVSRRSASKRVATPTISTSPTSPTLPDSAAATTSISTPAPNPKRSSSISEYSSSATKKDYKVLKEVGAAVMEDAFYDLYRHRRRIYRVNFMRGMFFGLGAFIGGTVIIACVIGLLSLLVQAFPDFSDYIQWLINVLSKR